MSSLSKTDVRKWRAGEWLDCYNTLGAHPDDAGVRFIVWAPGVQSVAVIGDFNKWDPRANELSRSGRGVSTFWEGTVPGAKPGQRYKFRMVNGSFATDKTDPFAFSLEPPQPGGSALFGLSSIITDRSYAWGDHEWLNNRAETPRSCQNQPPVSVYELHLGSWRRANDGSYLSYEDLARPLIDYIGEMGFTHVEFLPVAEHPFYASWGYQLVGYYAPTWRYGSPAGFKTLVDQLHQAGIGVYLDWVPAHFATDPQGLEMFGGKPLFEYEDPLLKVHPDWGTHVFDFGNEGVRNFLIANALFWLDEYHIDGLRVDAVASMLYRDYSRDEWSPNRFGGRENLEASSLLRQVNDAIRERFPGAVVSAEESTAWPGVTTSTSEGGLGFQSKWNMGWMNDTLSFFRTAPAQRKNAFREFTFPLMYAFSECYTLPLSHDEVVHGKGSLWGKMPGNPAEKASNLRLMIAHQFGHPGKKLLFSGNEFGQRQEWSHDHALEWSLLEKPLHSGLQRWVRELNELYLNEPALWNDAWDGFEWLELPQAETGVASYVRKNDGRRLLFVFNFSEQEQIYRLNSADRKSYTIVLDSQDGAFHRRSKSRKRKAPSSSAQPVFEVGDELALPPLTVLIGRPVDEPLTNG